MKKYLALMMAVCLSFTMVACGNNKEASDSANDELPFEISEEPITIGGEESSESVEEEETVEGKYRSELTNEWIDEELKDQRPVAVMVDNEIKALPHMGVNSADIVYEMVNSTLNGRITRLMCIVKDYNNIQYIGNVRSARPTNLLITPEYNAILIHDGGPFYINDFLARDWNNNLSGGFARISNGKSYEYTEYATAEDYSASGKSYKSIANRIADGKIDVEYNEYYPGKHFEFNNKDTGLDDDKKAVDAETIKRPFPHNESTLYYNDDTKLYEYHEYAHRAGDGFSSKQTGPHVDPLDDDNVLSFKNVIIYSAVMNQLDANGYMIYNVIGSGNNGYYITDGKAVPITWSKPSENELTVFKNKETGEDIKLNTGKTYIAIVPEDAWEELVIE